MYNVYSERGRGGERALSIPSGDRRRRVRAGGQDLRRDRGSIAARCTV